MKQHNTVKIANASGKTVYASTITQQSTVIDLGSSTGWGIILFSTTNYELKSIGSQCGDTVGDKIHKNSRF